MNLGETALRIVRLHPRPIVSRSFSFQPSHLNLARAVGVLFGIAKRGTWNEEIPCCYDRIYTAYGLSDQL
jgi:hypothetical protein